METLRCKVQDPGFPDTEVTCLKTDDGQTYFFIEDGTLKNGNIISTPVLKEGIGHAPYTSLGLITPQGDVLIPFENKNIKSLSNELLLVERNTPATESVVEALKKQSDPLSAGELIETANTIKEQMKSIMGPTSTYAFDNQFSEAALYTTSGVNLANDYFSFIAIDNGVYYMSKNVVGSSISKYDPYMAISQNQEEEVSDIKEESKNEETNTEMDNQPESTGEIMDTNQDIPLSNLEESQSVNDENIKSKEEEISNEAILPDINIEQSSPMENNINENSPIEIPSVPVENETEQTTNLSDEDEIENQKLSISEEMEQTLPLKNNLEEEKEQEDAISNEIKDEWNEKTDIFENNLSQENNYDTSEDAGGFHNTTDFSENIEESVTESELVDNTNYQDKIVSKEEDDYFEEQIGNPIIANATNTIRKLLEENRKQRQVIDRQEGEMETLNSSNEILKEDNSSKTKEIITLRNSNAKYRSDNTDLTRENNRLKSTVQRQEDLIEHLKKQNSALKEQVAGITALSNVVAEANNLFSPSQEENSANYDSEFSYLGEDNDSYQYTKKAA